MDYKVGSKNQVKEKYARFVSMKDEEIMNYRFLTSYNLIAKGFSYEVVASYLGITPEEVKRLVTDKEIYKIYFPQSGEKNRMILLKRLESIHQIRTDLAKKIVGKYLFHNGNLAFVSNDLGFDAALLKIYFTSKSYRNYVSEEAEKMLFQLMLKRASVNQMQQEEISVKLKNGGVNKNE